ncbi:MAG: hypothetical protein R1F52_06110 [Candidatus Nitrosoabyssus spongiisocia]|nr:MAG: hypothetical protein R1F52_06110 [Nitrosopumilaceae archaeon AB1(1)]
MVESHFLSHGIFELLAAGITVLGILLALDNRVVSNYDEITKNVRWRLNLLYEGTELKIINTDENVEKIRLYHVDIIRLEKGVIDYKYKHMLITICGIGIMFAYGIALLIEEFNYSFFISVIIIMSGMLPTIIHLLIHRQTLVKVLSFLGDDDLQYVELEEYMKKNKEEGNSA